MEQDRFQENHTLFIFGMLCMFACLICIGISLFLFPHIVFQWRYPVPDFVSIWREWFRDIFDVTERKASLMVLGVFLIQSILFTIFAFFASTKLDNSIYKVKKDKETSSRGYKVKETLIFALKVLFYMFLVLVFEAFFEWLISTTPP